MRSNSKTAAGAESTKYCLPEDQTFVNEQMRMLWSAFGGTILAAGLYPSVIAISQLEPSISGPAEFLLFSVIGAIYGVAIALPISGVIVLCLLILLWATGLDGRRTWLGSLVGGWTGFISATVFSPGIYNDQGLFL